MPHESSKKGGHKRPVKTSNAKAPVKVSNVKVPVKVGFREPIINYHAEHDPYLTSTKSNLFFYCSF